MFERRTVPVWRAAPPATEPAPPNKRAGRPKLQEPLPEGDIWAWNREVQLVGWLVVVVLSILGAWAGVLPHRHDGGVDCGQCDDR